MAKKKRKKTQQVTRHFRAGKEVKRHKRSKRRAAKGKPKRIVRKFRVVFFRDSNGQIVGKKQYTPI